MMKASRIASSRSESYRPDDPPWPAPMRTRLLQQQLFREMVGHIKETTTGGTGFAGRVEVAVALR